MGIPITPIGSPNYLGNFPIVPWDFPILPNWMVNEGVIKE
jgi:hypothetical protein